MILMFLHERIGSNFDWIRSETLIWYDGPRTFVARSDAGNLLFHWSHDTDSADVYLVAEITERQLDDLKQNRQAVRDLFDEHILMSIDMRDRTIIDVHKPGPNEERYLPHPGVTLYRPSNFTEDK